MTLTASKGVLNSTVALMLACLWGCSAPQPVKLSSFRTSLLGRTPGQRHNAVKAARAIDGTVISPDGAFSFNQRVGSWTRERGFVRAPVSLGGVLVPSWGGGVCQVSTTVYVAALLAGLEVTERHPHAVAPSYVPVGMDAAVAQGVADLKLRNPFAFPVQLRCFADGDRLVCQVIGLCTPKQAKEQGRVRYRLQRETVTEVGTWRRHASTERRVTQVRLWRLVVRDGKLVRRELCHETAYTP